MKAFLTYTFLLNLICGAAFADAQVTRAFRIGAPFNGATEGSVVFASGGVVSQDNVGLFWDDTNDRLGVGTASPASKLDVAGTTTSDNFTSDAAVGTQPYAATSTTLNTNLNADLLDSQHGSYYLDSANFTGANWTDLTDSGATTLHSHAGGGGAPTDASYVVLGLNATLTAERVLTGTANQITVTDGGAGGNVTLSTPQDIHTGASPTLVTAKLTNLTDGYLPYHISDASGLGNSLIFTDGTKIGVNTATPDGIAHIFSGSAGTVTAPAFYDDLTIENNGIVGITLLSPNTSSAGIIFGDNDNNAMGYVTYNHASDVMVWGAGGVDSVSMNSAGLLTAASLKATGLTSGRVPLVSTGGLLADDADLTFATDTLTATKLLAPTSVSTPSLISTGAVGVTPAAGSNLNVSLSTTGDLAVNTNQLYVDTSAGNVGIGTTAPGLLGVTKELTLEAKTSGDQVSLNISGYANIDGAIAAFLQFYNNGNRGAYIGSERAGADNSIDLAFATMNSGALSEKMRITKAGDVGIGTTTPDAKLQVNGILHVGTGALAPDVGSGDIQAGYIVTANNKGLLGITSGGSDTTLMRINTTDDSDYYAINKYHYFTANPTKEVMTILNSGYVGIGETTPTVKLQVKDTNTAFIHPSQSANGEIPAGVLFASDTNFTFGNTSGTAGQKGVLVYYNGGFLSAAEIANVSSGYGNLLLMKSGGNVGIGTATPQGKLDIATTATNDDINYFFQQARVATTNATVTTLDTFPITASRTYVIQSRVVARRTGGAAGTADDGAIYDFASVYTTKAGVVTLLTSNLYLSAADNGLLVCAHTISGTNVLLEVTGDISNDYVWHSTTTISWVGT